jgi:hypothetical protein
MILFLQKNSSISREYFAPSSSSDYCRNQDQSQKTKVEIAKEQARSETPPLLEGQDAAQFSLLF